MLICKRCNQENLDIAKFCKECGSSDLYDPQAQEKLEKERKIEEERKIAQEEREKGLKKEKNSLKSIIKKFILLSITVLLAFMGLVYDYYYGGKYSKVYISKLEKKCREDEASCKILQNIYKEKCDEGDGKACLASMFMSDNLIKVQLNGKWSFIGKNGELITESKFDDVGYFSKGFAKVKINGKYGLIDKSGNFVIKPIFDEIERLG